VYHKYRRYYEKEKQERQKQIKKHPYTKPYNFRLLTREEIVEKFEELTRWQLVIWELDRMHEEALKSLKEQKAFLNYLFPLWKVLWTSLNCLLVICV